MHRTGRVAGIGLIFCAVFLGAVFFGPAASFLWGATPAQEQKGAEIETLLQEAGKLAIAKKYEEAKPLVLQATEKLKELAEEGPPVKALVSKLNGRLAATHRIVAKGTELPALESIEAKGRPGKPAPAGAKGVSFTKDVAPIFVQTCNNCHVQNTRGGFNLGTYANLMKGSQAGGTVFTPGRAAGSRLMDVLESGDMPRGGGKLSNEQLATISKWIDEGAKFDGTDPNASIAGNTPAAPMPRPTLTVTQATGNEDVRFSRDLAGVFAEQCTGCHGGRQPAAQLRLENFTAILRGNNDGLIIKPGDPAASLLIRKLKGTAGDRMPLNRNPLPDDVIAKFEKWVAEGAKYDGGDPGDAVEFVAAVYRASVMSHDELKAERDSMAGKNWRLSNPDVKPDRYESENFLVLGNVDEERLAAVGKTAESLVPRIGKIFKAPADAPLFKGRMTLFVFNRRYDYSEFGQMVEKREVPAELKGHFKYNVVDAYGALVAPESTDVSVTALVGQQIAGAYVQSQGRVPGWFAQGTGWAVGARLDPKDGAAKRWNEEVPGILAQSKSADDFLNNKLPPGETLLLNYSFVDFLMSNSGRYQALLNNLRKGVPFDGAFQQAYGGAPNQVATAWATKAVQTPTKGKKRGK